MVKEKIKVKKIMIGKLQILFKGKKFLGIQ